MKIEELIKIGKFLIDIGINFQVKQEDIFMFGWISETQMNQLISKYSIYFDGDFIKIMEERKARA